MKIYKIGPALYLSSLLILSNRKKFNLKGKYSDICWLSERELKKNKSILLYNKWKYKFVRIFRNWGFIGNIHLNHQKDPTYSTQLWFTRVFNFSLHSSKIFDLMLYTSRAFRAASFSNKMVIYLSARPLSFRY